MNTIEHFLFEEFGDLIDPLRDDQSSKFGKMTPQHMVEHLGGIFLISAGKVNIGTPDPSQPEKYYKWFKSEKFGFVPNTKSPAMPTELPKLRFQDLKSSKEALKKAIKKFEAHFKENPEDRVTHPVFGSLDYQEWLRFHDIHTRHHLRQFALI